MSAARAAPLGAVVVGAGLMGRWHARTIERAGSRVVAVVDRDAASAAALAARHGARAATTLREAMQAHIDVAHICTPLESHDELAREAIAGGVHALVEKPLLETASDTASLLAVAESKGVLVAPVHQFPFQRGVRQIASTLHTLAPLTHVSVAICSAGAAGRTAEARDRIASEILPHPLSLFATLLGREMADVHWSVIRASPGELLAAGESGGVSLSILVSMSGRPTTNTLEVIGAGGSATADLFHGFSVIEPGAVSRARKIVRPLARSAATFSAAVANLTRRGIAGESAYPGLRELVAEFHAAVRRGGPSPIPPAQTLDVARARDVLLSRIESKHPLEQNA